MHCLEMKRLVRLRQAIVVTVSGKKKVKWAQPPPVVDWNRVAYNPDFGIFRVVKETKAWVAAYGKQLRKEIRAGLRSDMPDYVVRALLPRQSLAGPPALDADRHSPLASQSINPDKLTKLPELDECDEPELP